MNENISIPHPVRCQPTAFRQLDNRRTAQRLWVRSLLALAAIALLIVPSSVSSLAQTSTSKSTPSAVHPSRKQRRAKAEAAAQPAVPKPPPAPLTPAQQPAVKAFVTYTDGQVLVRANNSDLNQTLQQISRMVGIKLTGSTSSGGRFYGTYGPGKPFEVLTSLIDGTGTNMLYVHGNGTAPAELILTPRNGGPASPSAKPDNNEDAVNIPDNNQPPQQAMPPFAPQPLQQNITPGGVSGASPNQAGTAPADPNQPAANGVKTPQQIFEQLQRLRQQPPSQPTQQ